MTDIFVKVVDGKIVTAYSTDPATVITICDCSEQTEIEQAASKAVSPTHEVLNIINCTAHDILNPNVGSSHCTLYDKEKGTCEFYTADDNKCNCGGISLRCDRQWERRQLPCYSASKLCNG